MYLYIYTYAYMYILCFNRDSSSAGTNGAHCSKKTGFSSEGGLLVPRGLRTDCILVISGSGVNQILFIGLEGGMDVA